MQLTEEEIQLLTEKHRDRLRSAQSRLPESPMKVSDIQSWMVKNNLESPELLDTIIKKQGSGSKGEKKMSRMRRIAEISG